MCVFPGLSEPQKVISYHHLPQKIPDMSQLQATIQQQQEQLSQQSEQIRQSVRLDALQRQASMLQLRESNPTPTASPLETKAQQATSVPRQKTPPRLTISSGNNRIQLAVSGQVNRQHFGYCRRDAVSRKAGSTP